MVAVLESGIIVELHGPWWSLWCMVAKVVMIDVALILMWMVFVEVDAVVVVMYNGGCWCGGRRGVVLMLVVHIICKC